MTHLQKQEADHALLHSAVSRINTIESNVSLQTSELSALRVELKEANSRIAGLTAMVQSMAADMAALQKQVALSLAANAAAQPTQAPLVQPTNTLSPGVFVCCLNRCSYFVSLLACLPVATKTVPVQAVVPAATAPLSGDVDARRASAARVLPTPLVAPTTARNRFAHVFRSSFKT